ncbi:hypothetical protein, partial [Klebsiella pneumoniae]
QFHCNKQADTQTDVRNSLTRRRNQHYRTDTGGQVILPVGIYLPEQAAAFVHHRTPSYLIRAFSGAPVSFSTARCAQPRVGELSGEQLCRNLQNAWKNSPCWLAAVLKQSMIASVSPGV